MYAAMHRFSALAKQSAGSHYINQMSSSVSSYSAGKVDLCCDVVLHTGVNDPFTGTVFCVFYSLLYNLARVMDTDTHY